MPTNMNPEPDADQNPNQDAHALTGAYVCDALDAAERAAFEAHLATCDACAREVADLRETTAALAMAAAEPPPARLHAAVTAQIATTPQLPPLTTPGPAPTAAPGSGTETETATNPADPTAPTTTAEEPRIPGPASSTTVPAQIPGIPGPASSTETPAQPTGPENAAPTNAAPSPAPTTPDTLNSLNAEEPTPTASPQPTSPSPEISTSTSTATPSATDPANVAPITDEARPHHRLGRFTRATVAGWTLAAVLAGVAAGLGIQDLAQHHQVTQSATHAQQLANLLAAPDLHIGAGQVHGGGTVTFVESRKLNQVAITLADLPTLPEGKAYQLWMIGPSGIRSGGVVTSAETTSTTPILADGLGNTATLGMTIEPAHGTAQPTTTPILLLPMPT